MASPLYIHWITVKRILRYLKGTVLHGLHLRPAVSGQPYTLRALCDADWASDVDDRRSISGAAIYFGPNLTSWWSRKQQVVARSRTKVEYHNLAQTTAETSCQVPFCTPIIFCDNQSAVAIAHNPILYGRKKHMEIDVFFVPDKVLTEQLIVHHPCS